MFERFTNRARHVVVLAQEEARGLKHNYIGTEHVLLGLLGEPGGMAAQALDRFGMSLTQVREEVVARVGFGKKSASGHIPFTPRAKKVLELALREALEQRHNYIGTEHLLLGIIREGDGVAAQILRKQAGDPIAIRLAVLDLLSSLPAGRGPRWPQPAGDPASAGEAEEPRTTPATDISLGAAARLAGTQPIGSHHLLLAMLVDPDSAAARTLTAAGLDLTQAKEALRRADVTGTSDELPEEAGRRQMLIQVAKDRLTIEATDQTIVDLGRAALAAVGGPAAAGEPGTIRGDLPASASLSTVWQALRASLEDIGHRAAAVSGAGGPAGQDQPGETETGTESEAESGRQ